MSKSTPTDYRLKIGEPYAKDSFTYLTRYGGRVSYMTGSETPLALSNLLGSEAAEARFAMEDAADAGDAAKKLRSFLVRRWANNAKATPIVTVLS